MILLYGGEGLASHASKGEGGSSPFPTWSGCPNVNEDLKEVFISSYCTSENE